MKDIEMTVLAKCGFLDPNGFNELIDGRNGPRLYNRNDIYVGGSLAAYGEFSYSETEFFQQVVLEGNIVVEVGANIGAHTVDIARMVGPYGKVHAFEPQRLVFQVLCANLALNQLTNVYAYQAGVGASDGEMQVPDVDPHERMNYGGIPLGTYQVAETVRIVTVDSLDLAHCHMLKVDVEGMEVDVLTGAAGTIANYRPLMYVENDREQNSERLLTLIESYSYDAYWHFARLYNPENFARNPTDLFPGVSSINLLCIPKERPFKVAGPIRVESVRETWLDVVARLRG